MVVDSKDLQQQSKAFDKLTDRVEDRQLDSTRVQEAMASIAASSEADWNAMRLRSVYSNLLNLYLSKFSILNSLMIEFDSYAIKRLNFLLLLNSKGLKAIGFYYIYIYTHTSDNGEGRIELGTSS